MLMFATANQRCGALLETTAMNVKTKRGFTLIELMMVVVILSVLSVVAVASYARYQRNAKRGEAIELMNDIRLKQEAFFSVYSRYLSSTNDEDVFFGTVSSDDETKNLFHWDLDCANAANAGNPWCQLGFRPQGRIVGGDNFLNFQLQTIGWAPGATAPAYVTNPNAYWLTVQARGLQDGSTCHLLRMTNQVKDTLILETYGDCPL